MTEALVTGLTAEAARVLTDEVKADAAALWSKLLELYEGGAHTALGYASWGGYYEAEFGGSDATAYRILQSARIIDQLPIGSSAPRTESVARELTSVYNEDPERVEEVWGDVVEEHGPTPTAAQVREVVNETKGVRVQAQTAKMVESVVQKCRMITDVAPHIDLSQTHTIAEEDRSAWQLQLREARTALSQIIKAL